jgi:DNA-binding XRE family transcriptional regulator
MATAHETFYQEVGKRIRKARNGRKPPLTQEALGKLVSLNRTSITNIEKGRQNFLVHTLANIAAALHVTCASLLPDFEVAPEVRLEAALKGMPKAEKEWIKSALSATEKGRSRDGS